MQEFECIVDDVSDDYIYIKMYDLTDRSRPIEFAEIKREIFSQHDQERLQAGQVFYWTINENGVSRFDLYSPAPLSDEAKQAIQKRAEKLYQDFAVRESDGSCN